LLSCARGASALIGESSLSRTPEITLTVALAWTTVGGTGRGTEAEAAIARAANQTIAAL
jgi:hypothetical protein